MKTQKLYNKLVIQYSNMLRFLHTVFYYLQYTIQLLTQSLVGLFYVKNKDDCGSFIVNAVSSLYLFCLVIHPHSFDYYEVSAHACE